MPKGALLPRRSKQIRNSSVIRAPFGICFAGAGLLAATSAGDAPRQDFHTVVQTGSSWTPGTHLGTDLALVVGDESGRGWMGAAKKVETWRKR